MVVITGEKVLIRDRKPINHIKETIWGRDSEVTNLDPPSGKIFSSHPLSIMTLNGKHIGLCSLYNWDITGVQLGIRIGEKDYWGKGYGKDAIRSLVNYCFAATDVERVWLKVLPNNTRAIRCYERCGFVHVGRLALSGYEFNVMEIRRQ